MVHLSRRWRRKALWAAGLLVGLGVSAAWSVEPSGKEPPVPVAEAPPSPAPDLADVVPRAGRSAERLNQLRALLSELRTPPVAETVVQDRRRRVDELAATQVSLGQSATAGYVQYADLKAAVRAELEQLGKLNEQLAGALRRVDELRGEWLQEQQFWVETEESLSQFSGYDSFKSSIAGARRNTEQALDLLAESVGPTLEVQRGLGEIQGKLQQAATAVDGRLRTLRDDLYRRSGFPILSREYYAQFGPELWRELRGSADRVVWPGRRFFQTHGWVLLLQCGVAVALARALGRRREALWTSKRWRFLATRPLSVAIFVGFALGAPLYAAVALPSWRLLLWLVAAISAARLLGGQVREVWQRRLLYLLALLFLVTQALRVFGIPLPVFRLYVLGVGLCGAPLCLWRAGVNQRKGASSFYVLALRVGAAVLALTFVAQLAGYGAFATHLLTASIQTTFVVLLGWTLHLLARGALEFALGPGSWLHRYAPVQRNARQLANRLGIVVDLCVIASVLGLVLEVWRVYASPLEALEALLAMGVTLGGVRVSVGLILGAAAMLYGAVLFSGLIQELLLAEVYPRSHVEWGVRVSMNRLVHYGVVAVGFFIAVGILGVDFQNITILAGAFSIGIGFGLQNIVNNFVSGLILLFERPIKVGDVVMLDGEWATIKKLGLRATIVQTFGRSDIIVPNSELVSNKVTNWTLNDRLMRLSVPVGVAYGSDVQRTIETLREVGAAHPEVQKDPAPQVIFQRFGSSSLDFELRVWVDTERFVAINSELLQEIDRRFREESIEIAFPQRDLHLRTVDERAQRALGSLLAGGQSPFGASQKGATVAGAVPEEGAQGG